MCLESNTLNTMKKVNWQLPLGKIMDERRLERPYIAKKLLNVKNKIIVDWGCLDGSQKTGEIVGTSIFYNIDKSNTIIGVDIRDIPTLKGQYIVSDIISAPINTESVDIGLCISTIEHIGLTKYNNSLDSTGDSKALGKMIDVIKAGGKLYLTFPYGTSPTIIGGWIKVYTEEVLKSWELEHPNCQFNKDIFGLFGGKWYNCDFKDLEKVQSKTTVTGICCLEIIKK